MSEVSRTLLCSSPSRRGAWLVRNVADHPGLCRLIHDTAAAVIAALVLILHIFFLFFVTVLFTPLFQFLLIRIHSRTTHFQTTHIITGLLDLRYPTTFSFTLHIYCSFKCLVKILSGVGLHTVHFIVGKVRGSYSDATVPLLRKLPRDLTWELFN